MDGALRIVDQSLPLLHLSFGDRAHVDLGHAAGEFGESLLEFLAVVVACRLLDFVTDLGHPAVDGRLRAGAAHDRGVLGFDDHLLRSPKIAELHAIEGDSQVLKDRLATGENGQIAEHRLPPVAVAGRLDGDRLNDPTELVDDEGGQRLPLDILGNHDERLTALAHRLEQRHEVLGARDLLLEKQDVWILELADLALSISDKMGREEAAVKLHSLYHVDGRLRLLPFLDGDHTILANLEEGLGQHIADRGIVVAGDRGDLDQFLFVFLVNLGGHSENRLGNSLNSLVDAACQGHRVGSCRDHLEALPKDGLGEHSGRRGAVAGHVIGLAGSFFDQLRAEILEGILEVDVFGDGDAVLGHLGGAPALVENRIAAPGTERALDRAGEFRNAGEQRLASLIVEHHLFCHKNLLRRAEPARSTTTAIGRPVTGCGDEVQPACRGSRADQNPQKFG